MNTSVEEKETSPWTGWKCLSNEGAKIEFQKLGQVGQPSQGTWQNTSLLIVGEQVTGFLKPGVSVSKKSRVNEGYGWNLITNLAEASMIAFPRATKFIVAVVILHHVL